MARVASTRWRGYDFLTGVVARYRADQATLVSTKVSSWTDLSGNARHATQSTDASRWVQTTSNADFNNRATLDNDGTKDMATATWGAIAQPNVHTFVCKWTSMSSKCLFDSVTGHQVFQCVGISDAQLYDGATTLNVTTLRPESVLVPAARIVTVVFSGANSCVFINGAQMALGDAGTNGLQGLFFGAFRGVGNYFQGSLAEHIVQTSTVDLGRLWAYLSEYYAIPLSV